MNDEVDCSALIRGDQSAFLCSTVVNIRHTMRKNIKEAIFLNDYQHVDITFQPANLPQYPPFEALQKGTLWPLLFHPYPFTPNKR